MINLLLREQRDKAGLRALRPARGQDRRAVKSKTARDDGQMPERTFVAGDGAARREADENPPATSNSIRVVVRTRNQADVVRDFKPPDERPRGLARANRFSARRRSG